ncbi:hypothetical protein PQX77_017228 [Marasmius sp. AFHP31]|nr:hypothetical protein PQX77_017228 [Marasmius sp. AFHP31]
MSRVPVHLPTTTHPTEPPLDPSQNLVLLQSLRQSREKWVSSAFPKFSSTAKQSSKGSKNQNHKPPINPPPHSIQSRGKCDLAIGPHIFYDTTFYEVHYIRPTYYPNPSNNPSSTPTAVTMITPEIVNQVNLAASTNPTLANLLQVAANGQASPDQLKTLGLTIQSLASPSAPAYPFPGLAPLVTPSSSSSSTLILAPAGIEGVPIPTSPNNAEEASSSPSFDIIIEFRENSTERWLLPRGISSVSTHENSTTLTVTALLPFSKSTGTATASSEETEDRLVEFQLANAPFTIHDSLRRWAGGEGRSKENQAALEKAKAAPGRKYLSYEISDDPSLLGQLQAITAPPYTLKPIKPSSTHPRRTATKRKQPPSTKEKDVIPPIVIPPSAHAEPPPAVQATSTPAVASPAPPSIPSTPSAIHSSTPAAPNTTPTPVITPTAIASASGSALTFSIAPNSPLNPTMFAPSPTTFINQNMKKPRQPRQAKKAKPKSPPPVIRCLSCGQTDVPLLLGGRFCRPCVEGGRANPDIPQAPLMRSATQTQTQTMPVYVPKVQPKPSPLLSTASSAGSATDKQASGTALATQLGANVGTGTDSDVQMGGKETGSGNL